MPLYRDYTQLMSPLAADTQGGAFEDLLAKYEEMGAGVKKSQEERRKTVEAIYNEIIARYRPGGTFGKSYEEQLQFQKTQDVGATAQRDISRGMYGIRPYEQEWERTTGAPARLKLEDIRMERLSQAQTGMAEFQERIEEPYPDYSALAEAARAQASAPQTGYRLPVRGLTTKHK